MIRLFEYDAQITLDEGEVTEETLTVTFPNTAVLYLRTYKKTPDKMKYVINTSGGTVQYACCVISYECFYVTNDYYNSSKKVAIENQK